VTSANWTINTMISQCRKVKSFSPNSSTMRPNQFLPDQHVVCDTGSVDRTVEIARQMGAEVYLDFVWCDAFDLAQNHAKSKMKTDVIISIDCDEVMLSSEAEVRESVEQMQDVLRVNMVAEGTMLNFGFGRIFRNTPDIFWCQSIHKHLNIPGEGEPIGNIRIMYGFSPAHLNDPDRSLRMLEHTVATEENPVRNLYYLGREYGYKKRWQDCIDTLLRYVAVSEWEAEKAEAYLEIGQAYTVLGKFQEAADSFLQAIKINTNFREVLLEMAKISSDDNANANCFSTHGFISVSENAPPMKLSVHSNFRLHPLHFIVF